jgi:Helix-turn-helix domain
LLCGPGCRIAQAVAQGKCLRFIGRVSGLSFVEREEIALLHAQGRSMQAIARRLGRAASTISRELRRNAATRCGGLAYRATTAQWHAERAAHRPKPAKLAHNAALRTYVEERLAGGIIAPGGAPVPGPAVSWKGRRHGPRKDRRWANAWSPEPAACRSTFRMMRPAHQP